MVLRLHKGFLIFVITLLPGLGFCQLRPELIFCGDTLKVVHLDKKLMTTIEQKIRIGEPLSDILGMYTKHAYVKEIYQPIAGNYSFVGTTLNFTPLFPVASDVPYYARFTSNDILLDLDITIPSSQSPATTIEGIYPAADTLPENLLRMYIHFSAPMSAGEAYQHIQLVNDEGDVIDKPFLVIDQELWDETKTRFTLLFDPGRIKTGIKSNVDLGLPLQVHKSYRLVIDAAWRDEHGNALTNGFEKSIVVKDADRTRLTTLGWEIVEATSGTKNPLIVRFNKPIDHFLALKYIAVTDHLSNEIAGAAILKRGDTEWEFHPTQSWVSGTYSLQISPYLEDVAGNNFNNAFDVDLTVDSRVSSDEPVMVQFVIGNGSR